MPLIFHLRECPSIEERLGKIHLVFWDCVMWGWAWKALPPPGENEGRDLAGCTGGKEGIMREGEGDDSCPFSLGASVLRESPVIA